MAVKGSEDLGMVAAAVAVGVFSVHATFRSNEAPRDVGMMIRRLEVYILRRRPVTRP